MEVLVHIKVDEMTDKHTHIHGSDLVSQWIFQPYSNLTLTLEILILTHQQQTAFENIVEKE